MNKKGTSLTRAKNKYNKENYDRLYICVKKGEKDKYTNVAKIAGYHSLNEFVLAAIQDKISVITGDEQDFLV